MNGSRQLKPVFSIIKSNNYGLRFAILTLLIACLALSPVVQAVDPPPDGGYPNENTAEGEDALFSLVPDSLGFNTAIGFQALYSTTTGYQNTGVGDQVLRSNTTGAGNTAMGFWALFSNTIGGANTVVGNFALVDNTTGGGNTAVGHEVLENNTTGFGNTALGVTALTFSTTGDENTAVGDRALAFNSIGSFNTAIGFGALNQNTSGRNNIAVGKIAGVKLTTGSNNIDIGNQGKEGESKTIRIGTRTLQSNTYIAGISGVTVASGVSVMVDQDGHLGTVTSSQRYKEAIQPMKEASEAILSLKPVTFRYKEELDPEGIPQFGLVAEEVAKIDPDLVARDAEGKPYTVRYDAVNAMLLNEFLKEHRKVKAQGAVLENQQETIDSLKAAVATLQSTLEKQAAQLRHVSGRLESAPLAPRFVENH